jgi:predicted nucleotidyltransferase
VQFEKAIKALSDAGVEFVVIGGLSATLHGSARVTYDLDICYSRSSANLRRVVLALAPFHPRLRGVPANLPFIWDEGSLRNAMILTLQTDLGELDLLAEVAGVGAFDVVRKHSIGVEAFGCQISTLDLPSLIQAKRAAGREKDLAAIPELESLLENDDL